jgi:hypothetical protein
VARTAARYGPVEFGLRPMGGFEIEYNNVGKMLAVLIFSAKYEELVALPKACSVS